MYTEDAKQFTNIIQRYNLLRENDTMSAYTLMKDSLQVFNRWSEIREEITKSLKRGEDSSVKKRLEDKQRILIEIHTDARIIFNRSKKEMDFVREE
jgi:hypothetical protein